MSARHAWAGELAFTAALCIFTVAFGLAPTAFVGFVPIEHVAMSALVIGLLFTGVTLLFKALDWRAGAAVYTLVAATACAFAMAAFLIARIYPNLTPKAVSGYLYVLFDSTPREAWEFVRTYTGITELTLLAVVLIVLSLTFLLFRKSDRASRREKALAGAGALAAGLALLLTSSASLRAVVRPVLVARDQHRADMSVMARYAERIGHASVQASQPPALASVPQTYVLVIGESTTRHNLGLYGYGRPTNPRLSAERESLYVFGDAIAPHAHTVPALKKLLTFADFERPNAWRNGPDLLTIFRAAGFKTWWISNQELFGPHDTWVTAFSRRADHVFFTSVQRRAGGRHPLDDAVLEPFRRAAAANDPRKLIVVHLMGTHMRAHLRYPESLETFTRESPLPGVYAHVRSRGDKQAVDEYDNAVRFNDHVVAELLRLTRANAEPGERAALIYVADHGEEVKHIDSFLGHSEFQISRFMLEVPLIAWLSPEVQKGIEVSKAEAEQRPVQTDQLIHSLLHVAGITTTSYRAEKSMFAERYESSRRFIGFADYDGFIAAGGSRLALQPAGSRDFPARIWLHRTNSTGKLQALFEKFGGFELDVVFEPESRRLDVRHPPDPSTGLDLEEFFGSHPQIDQRLFWIDFKNLDEANAVAALAELTRIAERFDLDDQLIVESTKPQPLSRFTEAGFYTSYYLPDANSFDAPSDWMTAVAAELGRSRVNAISLPGRDYELLGDAFPGYDRLVWNADPRRVLRDPAVKVVLVRAAQ